VRDNRVISAKVRNFTAKKAMHFGAQGHGLGFFEVKHGGALRLFHVEQSLSGSQKPRRNGVVKGRRSQAA